MKKKETQEIKDSKFISLEDVYNELKSLQVLTRVNNILLSRFILQLSDVKQSLHYPKVQTLFRFEILDDDYKELVAEFGSKETDKALYKLDRLLALNKQNCPHNIKKYIRNRLRGRKYNKV